MKKFLTGLACLFVGFVIWFALSVVYGMEAGLTGEEGGAGQTVALAIPFAIMVVGPIVFWIVLPIRSRIKRGSTRQGGK